MPDSESKAKSNVQLKGILAHTASWARILDDGRIELEFYDHSPEAESHLGGDVAWMYWIAATEKPRLIALLQTHTGATITDDRTLLDVLYANFDDTWAIRDWLKENGIPYDEKFDSSA
ncbi:MAG: hypothetical protein ABSA32_05230 [Candidatus Acidiferrales bacterium]|jgi:hypothetical protein